MIQAGASGFAGSMGQIATGCASGAVAGLPFAAGTYGISAAVGCVVGGVVAGVQDGPGSGVNYLGAGQQYNARDTAVTGAGGSTMPGWVVPAAVAGALALGGIAFVALRGRR